MAVKWTEDLVLAVIQSARRSGFVAAQKKLEELQGNGPQFAVKDGNRTVGTMMDVCGSAGLKIKARVNSTCSQRNYHKVWEIL